MKDFEFGTGAFPEIQAGIRGADPELGLQRWEYACEYDNEEISKDLGLHNSSEY